ncbi:hypothetical protein Tco_0210106 [Tanacetum coccineum]
MAGSSMYIVTFVLTQRELDAYCSTFNIPANLQPELPDRNATIKDSPARKIGMYTRFIEFSNFRIPLSKFLLCVLEYYQINLSQLSVIGAAKVSHFELMCRVLGRVPTMGTFRRFYVNSISNSWLSFSKRGSVDDPCCYSKKFDSLKNLNNRFFWIDASVYPLSIPWFNGTFVVKDSPPVDEAVFALRLSRSLTRPGVRPTFLYNNDEEMGLLDFVNSADPFKVKVGERTLAENEVPLLSETEDSVISPSPQTISLKARTEGVKISEPNPTFAGKSPTALTRLELQSGWEGAESGYAPHPTKEFISSSITPIPERDIPEDSSSTQDMNVQARCPPGRYVVVSSSSEYDDVNTDVSPRVKSPLPYADVEVENTWDVAAAFAGGARVSSIPGGNVGTSASVHGDESPIDDFYESQTVDSVTTQNVYVPEWNIINDARIDNPALYRNLLDHINPPGYWAALRNQTDARFLDCFNINLAQLVCMVSKLRLRDAEIIALKARLEIAEKEAAKNAELSRMVSALELVHEELNSKVSQVTTDCDGLQSDVTGEVRMRAEFMSQQDAMAQCFDERVMELDARITDVRRDIDTDLYPHMLTAIAGWRWVVGHGFRLAVYKCARSVECRSALGKVEAYDPRTEARYVSAVSKFENVSFSLLEELEGLNDSPLALIMSALTLKDGHGDVDATPGFRQFQPSLNQVTIPIYSESGSISREMLFSEVIPAICGPAERRGLCSPLAPAPFQDSSLGVTHYQVSTLVSIGDAVPATQPHDNLFDTTVLDELQIRSFGASGFDAFSKLRLALVTCHPIVSPLNPFGEVIDGHDSELQPYLLLWERARDINFLICESVTKRVMAVAFLVF